MNFWSNIKRLTRQMCVPRTRKNKKKEKNVNNEMHE